MALRVFCSYSHLDEPYRLELDPFLAILRREQLISDWNDRKIEPGDDWAREIDEALNRSDLILLLISANFISSNYAYQIEMTRALELNDMKKARVVPILIRDTPLGGDLPFERLQMIPRDRRAVTSWPSRDAAWTAVAGELRELARKMMAEPENPLKARRVLLECRSLPNEMLCVFDKSAVLGRAPGCDIALTQGPSSIGKEHARFFFEPKKGEFLLDDLDSRNGTFVDGQRIRQKPLNPGSRVDLGRALSFTFWRYEGKEGPAGALLYTRGEKEVARYVLAPFLRAGLGTTNRDALQVPLLAEGKSIGTLESTQELLYYTSSSGGERLRLAEKAAIDAQALTMDLRILE